MNQDKLNTSDKNRLLVNALTLNRQFYLVYHEIGQYLTDELINYPKTYWLQLNHHESKLVTNHQRLKRISNDGKNSLKIGPMVMVFLRFIQVIPSAKAETFKPWLAKVGTEN